MTAYNQIQEYVEFIKPAEFPIGKDSFRYFRMIV